MAHKSENCKPLRIAGDRGLALGGAESMAPGPPAVWAFVLPFNPASDKQVSSDCVAALQGFAKCAHEDTTIAVLTTPQGAAGLLPQLEGHLRFQLWVALKLKHPIPVDGQLPAHHAALLILTKYHGSLRHTKTRIGYTFCPACDKTTKDYGGKKHTYNSYGTLISDVWRDIDCDPGQFPDAVIERLGDLFGLPPYDTLNVVDLRTALDTGKGYSAPPACDEVAAVPSDPAPGLINGDCLEALRKVPSESIDFCFADPPYNLKKKYDNWNDGLDIVEYFRWCDEWLGELARVLKPGCTLAVLNIPLWAVRHFSYLKTILNFQSWIVWEGLSLPVRMIMPAHYSIVCFSKGPARVPPGLSRSGSSSLEDEALGAMKEWYCLRQDCVHSRRLSGKDDTESVTDLWWEIHRLKHNSRRVDHPCQLPPALMRRLIALFTAEGEYVLDPFNGAGTTTLAAEQLGRKFIGIELSAAYHQLAMKRHDELRLGIDPFGKTQGTPNAKNSPVKRLPKQQYAVPKKVLQLEVRRIARELGRLPSREEVAAVARFPIEYYDKYFISWGEVCAAARNDGMTDTRVSRRRPRCADEPSLFDTEEVGRGKT